MYWLAIGPPTNWEVGLNRGIWGIPAKYEKMWQLVESGDTLVFYATKPVSGVIGYGTVRGKECQQRPIWPEEIEIESALWPLRFNFDVTMSLASGEWQVRAVRLPRGRITLKRAFQRLKDKMAQEFTRALEDAAV